MGVDADRHEADHVFVDAGLALQLGHRRRGRVDVEHDVMRLAVLGDAVGEAAQAPGFSLDHLAAVVGDNLGGVFRERIDLGLCQVLAREENMLVKRHVPCTYIWPIADARTVRNAPPAVVQKQAGRRDVPSPGWRAYGSEGVQTQAQQVISTARVGIRPWKSLQLAFAGVVECQILAHAQVGNDV